MECQLWLTLCNLWFTVPMFELYRSETFDCWLRELRDRLCHDAPDGIGLDELSMGMSGDFEIAIEEGATIVRVGQAIYGARSTPDAHYWPTAGEEEPRS